MARSCCRLLSWLCAFGIFAFVTWLSVTLPEYSGIPWFCVVIFVVGIVTLRVGANGRTAYWVSIDEPNQVVRVSVMIVVTLLLQLAIGATLQLSGFLTDFSSILLNLGIWIGVPTLALLSGVVTWPKRNASPSRLDFAIVAVIALILSMALCLLTAYPGFEAGIASWSAGLGWRIVGLFAAATMEEIVFRVLLLTAIVRMSGSRVQALVLSTTLFAILHAPLAMAEPVVAMDWDLLHRVFASYMPGMLWLLGLGYILGALWLRTGSLTLVAIVHGLFNLGLFLAGD